MSWVGEDVYIVMGILVEMWTYMASRNEGETKEMTVIYSQNPRRVQVALPDSSLGPVLRLSPPESR